MKIKLSLLKSLEENISDYYEKIKKYKHKLKRAKEIIKETEEKINRIKDKEEKQVEQKKEKIKKRQWFEKFRWFYTSEGFLCIGGRDATTNEIIIKKHTSKDDIVFHTDMAGSPFFVIKTEGKKAGEESLKQAADATITFSRAWKLGLLTGEVFYVSPEQITKEAQSGEYLGKGSFVIRGKTNYIDNRVNLAVCNFNEMIMAGPVEAIKKHCKKFVVLEQGDEKVSEIAKKIKRIIGGEIDDIIRALPSGRFKIRKK